MPELIKLYSGVQFELAGADGCVTPKIGELDLLPTTPKMCVLYARLNDVVRGADPVLREGQQGVLFSIQGFCPNCQRDIDVRAKRIV